MAIKYDCFYWRKTWESARWYICNTLYDDSWYLVIISRHVSDIFILSSDVISIFNFDYTIFISRIIILSYTVRRSIISSAI